MARAKASSLLKDNSGIAALEVAIIGPILLMLLLGAVEYGWYFIKSETVTRSVSNISDSIQRHPADGTLQNLAVNSGLGVVNFHTSPNFICAQSFSSYAAATAAHNGGGVCTGSTWSTGAPTSGTDDNGNAYAASEPYYVGIKGYVAYKALTPVMTFVTSYSTSSVTDSNTGNGNTKTTPPLLPGIQSTNIIKVTPSGANAGLPSCAAGVSIVSNGSGGFVCGTSGAPQCRMVYMVGTHFSGCIKNVECTGNVQGSVYPAISNGNQVTLYVNGPRINYNATPVSSTNVCNSSEYLLGPTGAPFLENSYESDGGTPINADSVTTTPFMCCKLPGY